MSRTINEQIGNLTGIQTERTSMQISRESLTKLAERCKKNESYEQFLKRIGVL